MYLHNVSGSEKTYLGKTIGNDEYLYMEPSLRQHFSEIAELRSDIGSGLITISRDGVTDQDSVVNMLAMLDGDDFRSSLAVDKDGNNQNISGNGWHTITGSRVLWDINQDWDGVSHDFVVPLDGVYNFDIQQKITNLSSVSRIEMALFKRIDGNPENDDYWFIIDEKSPDSLTEVQMDGATQFDFYEGERYCIKIKLEGLFASATLSGNDDYTAWGFNLSEIF